MWAAAMARIGRQRDRLASDTRVPSNKLPAIAIAASSSVVARPASSEAPYWAQSTTVAFHVMRAFLSGCADACGHCASAEKVKLRLRLSGELAPNQRS